MSEHTCAACGLQRMYRSERLSLLERFVYPFAGLYPWTCKGCRKRVLLKDRGSRRYRSSTTPHPVRAPKQSSSEAV